MCMCMPSGKERRALVIRARGLRAHCMRPGHVSGHACSGSRAWRRVSRAWRRSRACGASLVVTRLRRSSSLFTPDCQNLPAGARRSLSCMVGYVAACARLRSIRDLLSLERWLVLIDPGGSPSYRLTRGVTCHPPVLRGHAASGRIQNEYTVFKRYRPWRGTVSPDACKPIRILQANDVTSTPIHWA